MSLAMQGVFPAQYSDGVTKGGVPMNYEECVAHESGHLMGLMMGIPGESKESDWAANYVSNIYRSAKGRPLEAGHVGAGKLPAGFVPAAPAKPPHKKAK